jgi:hypothetical protein
VQPRWRLTPPVAEDNAMMALLRLPDDLRAEVLKACYAAFDPISQAKLINNDEHTIASHCLEMEKNQKLPKAFNDWQTLVEQQSPKLLKKAKQALADIQAATLTPLRDGWIYVYVAKQGSDDYHLYAEYQVSNGQCSEVDLSLHAGSNNRRSSGLGQSFIIVPYADDKYNPLEAMVCFADVQWSWPRVSAMGKTAGQRSAHGARDDPTGPRNFTLAVNSAQNDLNKKQLRTKRIGHKLNLTPGSSKMRLKKKHSRKAHF